MMVEHLGCFSQAIIMQTLVQHGYNSAKHAIENVNNEQQRLSVGTAKHIQYALKEEDTA